MLHCVVGTTASNIVRIDPSLVGRYVSYDMVQDEERLPCKRPLNSTNSLFPLSAIAQSTIFKGKVCPSSAWMQ
jgi:hypothetical protein